MNWEQIIATITLIIEGLNHGLEKAKATDALQKAAVERKRQGKPASDNENGA